MGERLLVFGASGFLGSEIVRQAETVGLEVTASGRRAGVCFDTAVYHPADILNPDAVRALIAGHGAIVHAAGLAHVFDPKQATADRFEKINRVGTRNVVAAAVESGIRHVVLISSVSVYGPNKTGRPVDEGAVCQPLDAYALSKLHAEEDARRLVQGTATKLTILRPSTIFGEKDRGNISRLMRTVRDGRFFWIGSGENRKSLIHRQDMAVAALLPLTEPILSPQVQTFNVTAYSPTMREIVNEIGVALDRRIPGWHLPAQLPMAVLKPARSIFSSSKGPVAKAHNLISKWIKDDIYAGTAFEQAFNFSPAVNLQSGISREADWLKSLDN